MKALSVKNLTKIYRDGVQALNGIDLTVDSGDFYALLGPNGAGKSTLIGIITSLVRKTAGKVSIFGHDIDENFSQAKSCMGVVPQEFNFGIFEKVHHILVNQAGYYGVSRKDAYERSEKYMNMLGLWPKRNSISRHLSGGWKRRLMLARALMHEPELLILDEPTTGIDIELRRSTWDLLKKINQSGTTIILTTHYLEEAEYLCKNIAIINHGEIIERGSLKTLLNQLEMETFVFDLNQPIPTDFHFGDFTVRVLDEHTFELDIDKRQSFNELFSLLSEKQILVRSMRNKVNRLEELFFRLTTKVN